MDIQELRAELLRTLQLKPGYANQILHVSVSFGFGVGQPTSITILIGASEPRHTIFMTGLQRSWDLRLALVDRKVLRAGRLQKDLSIVIETYLAYNGYELSSPTAETFTNNWATNSQMISTNSR